VADFNGDGEPDLAVSNENDGTVGVLLNTTAPGSMTFSFATQTTFAAGTNLRALAVGDLDGDGLPDLITASVSATGANDLTVLMNTTVAGATTPTFTVQTGIDLGTGTQPRSIAVGDFNGDGLLDLATANFGPNTTSVLLNTTVLPTVAPTFIPQTSNAGGDLTAVAIGDINGDGKPDLVVSDFLNSSVKVLLNTTPTGAITPTFAAPVSFSIGGTSRSLLLADLNGDGLPDIVIGPESNSVSVLVNTTAQGATTPTFAPIQNFNSGGSSAVAVADLNGDGLPDIVAIDIGYPNPLDTTSAAAVLLNTTTPGSTTLSFAAPQFFATGNISFSVALGDLNGDGKPDIVVANQQDNTVSVLLNTTVTGSLTASFATQQTFATGSAPESVVLGDINGDGLPDIVVANSGASTVSVLLNTTTPGASTASFATQQTFTTGSGPNAVALADVNGDGRPDLIVPNINDGTVSVLLNTTAPGASTASFATQQTFTTGASPNSVAVGDLTNNGRANLVTTNDGQGAQLTVVSQSPGTITNGTGTGTITESDSPPTVEFTAASESVNDTAGTFTITVSLSSAAGVETTIPFTLGGTAVAGTDYSGVTTSPLVIAAGQTTATITGKLLDNAVFGAANKALTFTLGTPTNATPGAPVSNTLTIVNTATQPVVQISTSNNTVAASGGTFSVTVNLSGRSTTATTVPFTLGGTAVAGVEYSNVTTSPLVIPAGQTTATITGTLIPHAGPSQTLAIQFANTTDTLTITEPSLALIATGAGPGSPPLVRVFNADGSLRFSFDAYDSGFTGGVNVAVGDVNGDGIPDIITGPGPGGGPLVKVFDGSTGNLIASFFTYDTGFRGGVSVAAGDVNGDGKADIITGAGPSGGPQVQVFDATKLGMVLANGQLAPAAVLQSFFAYNSSFRGGVNVAAGDVNGDGKADIITSPGLGGGPQVEVFNGATDAVLLSFYAFSASFTGGVSVAAGDVNGDGKADLIVGSGPGVAPQVRVYSGADGSLLQQFEPYNALFQGGVSVAAADVNGDGITDIITGPGPGGAPQVEAFNGKTDALLESYYAEDATLTSGVMVG
jgi:hypothetical protein